MRTTWMRWLMGVFCGGMLVGTAVAEHPDNTLALRASDGIYDYSYYQPEEAPGVQPDSQSPSDVPVPSPSEEAEEPQSAKPAGCEPLELGCGCEDVCGRGTGCGGGDPAPWTLPQPCLLQAMGVRVGGWLQQGITFNGNNPANGFNGPVATNDWDGEYQMNQLWLFLDRPADNGGYGLAVGGHIDMLLGTDWRFGVDHGLENRINGFNNQSYGMVIPQLYLEIAYHRLSLKLGHFAGILDYEAVPAVMNPFYSHSYSYGYTVDQLVTGLLGEYKMSDQWSLLAGFTRGWFMFEDLNHHLDFTGGIRWSSADKRTSLAYSITVGPQDVAGQQQRFASSLVLKQQFTEKFQYILVHNLGVEDDATIDDRDGEWYGINQYFLYKVSPKWSFGARIEWLRDDDGTRVMGPGVLGVALPGVYPDVRAFDGFGFAGNFYELSLGANWRPHPNFLIRPECRWDWYDGLPGVYARSAQAGMPFNDGNSDQQFTFGVDMVITY